MDKLLELAEQMERSAVADAEDAIANKYYAKRADRKFRIAAALRDLAARATQRITP